MSKPSRNTAIDNGSTGIVVKRTTPVSYRPQPGQVMGAIIMAVLLFWCVVFGLIIYAVASSA